MPYSIPLEVNMPSYKCLHGRNYIVDNKSVAPTKKKWNNPWWRGAGVFQWATITKNIVGKTKINKATGNGNRKEYRQKNRNQDGNRPPKFIQNVPVPNICINLLKNQYILIDVMLDFVYTSWIVKQILEIQIWEKDNSITAMTDTKLSQKTGTDERGLENSAMLAPCATLSLFRIFLQKTE